MEGIIVIIFLLIIAVLVLLIYFSMKGKDRDELLKLQLNDIRRQVHTLMEKVENGPISQAESVNEVLTKQETVSKQEEPAKNVFGDAPVSENQFGEVNPFPPFSEGDEGNELSNSDEELEDEPVLIDLTNEKESTSINQKNPQLLKTHEEVIQNSQRPIKEKVEPKKNRKPQKTTDFEKFIGENLLVKIAVFILILGVAFLIKWGIDNDYINEAMRIVIGFGTGGIMLTLGFFSRKKYASFSSVLSGGGIAALYVSTALGFQLYELFSQTIAFVILVLITTFTVVMALGYDKKSLVIFALIGGFASPLMVSNGGGNYIVLFTYILILNTGMMVLAYFKKWNFVNLLTLVFTMLLYGSWLAAESNAYDKVVPYSGAFIFATIFYITFFLMFIVNNIKERTQFKGFDMSLLMMATFGYYGAGLYILDSWQPQLQGLFTIGIATFNFAFALPLYKKGKVDKNLIYMLIAVVLTLTSAAAPVQLEGQYITIFWAIESAVLLWLAQKSGILLIRIASGLVFFLAIISLVMDWFAVYWFPYTEAGNTMSIFLNKGFITGITVVAAMIVNVFLLKNDDKFSIVKKMSSGAFQLMVTLILLVCMYLVFLFELKYHLDYTFVRGYSESVFIALYNFTYVFAVVLWAAIKKVNGVMPIMAVISFLGAFIYCTFFYSEYADLLWGFFTGEVTENYYTYKLLTSISVAGGLFGSWLGLRKLYGQTNTVVKLSLWVSVFAILFVFSQELLNIAVVGGDYSFSTVQAAADSMLFYNESKDLKLSMLRIGFPVLWGSFSFLLIIAGMKFSNKDMRIVALAVFTVTLIKLFAFDVWNMSEIGRVVAFISLGILLLIVAFLYQKLKKIFVGTEESVPVEKKEVEVSFNKDEEVDEKKDNDIKTEINPEVKGDNKF